MKPFERLDKIYIVIYIGDVASILYTGYIDVTTDVITIMYGKNSTQSPLVFDTDGNATQWVDSMSDSADAKKYSIIHQADATQETLNKWAFEKL